MYNKKMKKLKIIFFFLFFNVFMVKTTQACDLLSINIGGNKSSVQNIFGTIDDEDINEDYNVTQFSSPPEAFCTSIDLGNVTIKGYIIDNKVGAVEIEVMNGPENEESKKGLVRSYVESNFGNIGLDSKEWPGYKIWNIGNKQIFYYNMKDNFGKTQEGVAVTSAQYYRALVDDE